MTPRLVSPLPAVILAGGKSERMGFPKVKLARDGNPLILQLAERLLAANWKLECVVVSDEELAKWVNHYLHGIPAIINPFPQEGMISSLRLALKWAESTSPGLLGWPVDHPLIEIETLQVMRQAATRVNVVVPTFEQKRGHPTWWGKKSWKLLKSHTADHGANRLLSVLSLTALNIAEVAVDDPGVLVNIDTPESAATFNLYQAE